MLISSPLHERDYLNSLILISAFSFIPCKNKEGDSSCGKTGANKLERNREDEGRERERDRGREGETGRGVDGRRDKI